MTLTLTHRPHGRTSTDTPPAPPTDRGRAWLTRLLAGDLALPAVQAAALVPADRQPAEFDAAARAAGCPDLFVLDAPERPARERVLADIARTAALKGERVLLLSPDPAAADRVVEMLSHFAVSVVRALADDENPFRPSQAVTRLTSANAGAAHADKVIREAGAPVAALEAKVAPCAALGAILADLRERAVRFEQIEVERAALEAADPLAQLRAEHDATLARLTAERDALAAIRREKEAALAAARQHTTEPAAAHKTGFFARLLGMGKTSTPDPAEVERHPAELDREIQELAAHETKLAGEYDHAAAAFAADRESRRAERGAKLAALTAEADSASAVFRGHRPAFEAAGFAAPWPTTHSVDTTTAALSAVRTAAERDLSAARDRATEFSRPDLVREFLSGVRVVVGTPGCLHADAVFAPPSEPSPPFGLLILDHAEELGEQDFANLSRVAERLVLAGDAALPEEPKPQLNGTGAGHNPRPRRPAAPSLVARLARLLDREPWAIEHGRLVCRLAHITPDQRRTVTVEPVVDNPAIELRFADVDVRKAVLAEVVFPAGATAESAKTFLIQNLGETLLRPVGDVTWQHAADRLTACWPAADTATPVAWVDHDGGVLEKVVGSAAAAFTAAVAFDTASGWDAEKAAAWLADRLPAPAAGRLAVLPRDPSVPAGTTPRAAIGV